MSADKTAKPAEVKKNIFSNSVFRTYLALFICALLAIIITYVLYNYTQKLLVERLRQRIISIVSTAATQIDPDEVGEIHSTDDLDTTAMKHIVSQLAAIRDANSDVRYAYVMRRTTNPNTLEFVADAESLRTAEELDENENGVVEDDEVAPLPGDPFDIAEYPALKNEAFYWPTADNQLEEDQWSIQMSAYAPVYDEAKNAIAIIGIDVEVVNFKAQTQETLAPFLLFIIFLILLLSLLTSLLVRFYGERVQALQEIDRQKDELLSIVSHQLATPVSSVKWYLEMLLDGDVGVLAKEQKEYLATMQSVTRDLSDLVSMILDVSRIQLGKMKVDKQEIDLNEFLKEIFIVIDPKAQEKQINFIKDIPENIPTASLDKRLMRMTIENLLTNAVKYTPTKGEVKMTLKLLNNGNTMHIEVKDTGIGIPEKDKEKMFSKQFRASNTGSIDGNGFGLYVAKGAIEGQGGKIWFESIESKGTTFFIDMPLK